MEKIKLKLFHKSYGITEDGIVINIETKKQLIPQKHLDNYIYFIINKKRYFAHRLVAEAFVPNEYNKLEVDHLDGDRTNNHKSNLRWVTSKENAQNKKSPTYRRMTPHERFMMEIEVLLNENMTEISKKRNISYRHALRIKKQTLNKYAKTN